jgi:hypothetical protein
MKRNILILALVFAGAIASIVACKKDDYKNLDCSTISSGFAANIKPIIDRNCISTGCHNSGSSNGDLTTYAGCKAKVDNGSLNSRVLEKKDMPDSKALSLDDRKKIKCWIEGGAPNN